MVGTLRHPLFWVHLRNYVEETYGDNAEFCPHSLPDVCLCDKHLFSTQEKETEACTVLALKELGITMLGFHTHHLKEASWGEM